MVNLKSKLSFRTFFLFQLRRAFFAYAFFRSFLEKEVRKFLLEAIEWKNGLLTFFCFSFSWRKKNLAVYYQRWEKRTVPISKVDWINLKDNFFPSASKQTIFSRELFDSGWEVLFLYNLKTLKSIPHLFLNSRGLKLRSTIAWIFQHCFVFSLQLYIKCVLIIYIPRSDLPVVISRKGTAVFQISNRGLGHGGGVGWTAQFALSRCSGQSLACFVCGS